MTTEPDVKTRYDSRPATLLHSLRVGQLMAEMIGELVTRAVQHDLSKTQDPEREAFDRMTPRLSKLVYGTPEYAASLAELGPALQHHYAVNPHHPEHRPDGINGMTLLDLVEMLADWKAGGERMADGGDLLRSIRHGMDRFQITPQLAQILLNTACHLGWLPPDDAAELEAGEQAS